MLIGIVGKPNCGKSTFFKAATLAEIEIADYPFATIDANEGIGFVKHKCVENFFNVKCNPQKGFCINGERFIPVKLLDVAGLVPGAHKGKGLGNKFLNDLSTADVLIHIIDASGSTDEKGNSIKQGSYDPANDVRFLEKELDMWLFGIFIRGWNKFSKQTVLENKPIDKSIAEHFSGLKINSEMIRKVRLNLKLNSNLVKWTDKDIKLFASELRRISKPIIIAANKIDLPYGAENLKRLQKEFPSYKIIPCSAESELALREAAKRGLIQYVPGNSEFKILKYNKLNYKQKQALDFINKFLKKWKDTGVQKCLNTAVYNLLNYITVFPGGVSKLSDAKGNILPDAFLLPPRSTAIDFARTVHTDFAKKFIRAIDVKTKKTIGKDYLLKDGDVIEIISEK